jgi:membrane protein
MSLRGRAVARVDSARRRWPVLDHAVRTQQHYSRVNAGSQAGAVTYFAFLSFFPILALAFFVVGYVTRYFPNAQSNLVDGIEQVFPGMIGTGEGQIELSTIQSAAATVGIIGLATLAYSGLGWLSGMRTALQVVFELPAAVKPGFVVGKARDLVTLVVVGLTLLATVAISGVVIRVSDQVLDLLDLDHDLSWTVAVAAVLIALLANTVLFFVLFTVLARPRLPRPTLWRGALLGSVAFEILKQLSSSLLASTHRSPAFQAFGIALILLVWINYFSRIVMYAAAWAVTSSDVRREGDVATPPSAAVKLPVTAAGQGPDARPGHRLDPRVAFAAGAAAALGLVAAVRRRRS